MKSRKPFVSLREMLASNMLAPWKDTEVTANPIWFLTKTSLCFAKDLRGGGGCVLTYALHEMLGDYTLRYANVLRRDINLPIGSLEKVSLLSPLRCRWRTAATWLPANKN